MPVAARYDHPVPPSLTIGPLNHIGEANGVPSCPSPGQCLTSRALRRLICDLARSWLERGEPPVSS